MPVAPAPPAASWLLDPAVDFLNHGSFGACPRPVLAHQQELRASMEQQPVQFLARELPGRLDAARERLAGFLGADPEGIVAVPNATTGVSTVLHSLLPRLHPGDELLTTDHAYNASRNALEVVASAAGARVVVAAIPFPLADPAVVAERVLAAATPRTRLALVDHVTSPTGLVLPVREIVTALEGRGVEVLVDGAHAPGMVPLALEELAASYYTGNCHKWLCAPKGAAFLWVRRDRRDPVRPLVTSHGYNVRRPGRSRLHDEFDWTGTADPTAFLCVPAALQCVGGMRPGGWPEVMAANRALALRAREVLATALGCAAPAPDAMIGSLASLPLPAAAGAPAASGLGLDPLQDALLAQHGIEVPVFSWPAPPSRLLRISAQLYNNLEQYRRLADALPELL